MGYELLAAAGVLALLTMVPGPDMAVVTRRAVAAGRSDGLRTVAGITTGLLVWGVLAVAGLAAVLAASATAYTVVKLAGAAYLMILGVQALRAARRARGTAGTKAAAEADGEAEAAGAAGAAGAAATAPPTGHPWRTGFVGNLLNPKIAVFYTGLLPTLAPHGLAPHTGMALLVLVHAVLTVGWLGGYVLLLTKARAFFARASVRRAMERITGVVLIGFGVKVATASQA
ncbi:LysE family translocator [Streptomyces sp. NPDC090025]|uniref:LysE family translocator n=1 Tax=Streptomyces sp. NPDC090025 TaxID=3365922 RepID=UPI0038398182